MATFIEEDYFQILNSSIRGGTTIPFNCYFLLSNIGRIVQCVKALDYPNYALLEKLRSAHSNILYIEKNDLEKYKAYLKEYFNSEEGNNHFHGILLELEENPEVQGVPRDFFENLVPAPPRPEEETSVTVKGIKEKISTDLKKVEGGLQELEAVVRIKGDAPVKDGQVHLIKGTGEKDDSGSVTRIKGDAAPPPPDFKVIVSGFREAIKGPYAEKVKSLLGEVNKGLNTIMKISGQGQNTASEEVKVAAKVFLTQLNDKLQMKVLKEEEWEAVSEEIRGDFSALKENIKALPERAPTIPFPTDRIDQIIKACAVLKVLLEKKEERFPMMANLKEGYPSKMSGDILRDLQGLKIFAENFSPGGQPPSIGEGEKLADKNANKDIEKELTLKIGFLKDENKDLQENLKAMTAKVGDLEKQIKKMSTEGKSTEERLEEFTQYMKNNSQYVTKIESEVKGYGSSMMELEKLLQDKDNEIDNLGRAHKDVELQTEKDQGRIKDYMNLVTDLRTTVADKMKEIEKLTQSLGELERGQLDEAKRSVADLMMEKDRYIKLNFEGQEKLRDKLQEIQKKNDQMNLQAESLTLLKKKLASGLEKLEIQRKNFLSKQDSMNAKIIMLTNLNEQSRKAIERLTKVNENLRKRPIGGVAAGGGGGVKVKEEKS